MQKRLHTVASAGLAALMMFVPATYGQDDTLLATDEQKFSYAAGVQIGLQLKQQLLAEPGLDLEAVLSGLAAAILDQEYLISREEMFRVIDARRQVEAEKAAEKTRARREASRNFLEEYRQRDGVTVTESGLMYTVINSGDPEGDAPELQDTVVVHYVGELPDGTVFDSSLARGEPASFSLQSIVPGWQEALQRMRPGDKWQIVLPPELGYGERGAGQLIGPNAVLIFEIDLLEIKKPGNTE